MLDDFCRISKYQRRVCSVIRAAPHACACAYRAGACGMKPTLGARLARKSDLSVQFEYQVFAAQFVSCGVGVLCVKSRRQQRGARVLAVACPMAAGDRADAIPDPGALEAGHWHMRG